MGGKYGIKVILVNIGCKYVNSDAEISLACPFLRQLTTAFDKKREFIYYRKTMRHGVMESRSSSSSVLRIRGHT
jgi:hypothetical protein